MPLYSDTHSVFFRVREAHTTGNFALVLDLFNTYPAECWYGGEPSELITILRGLPHGSEQQSGFVRYATDYFSGQLSKNAEAEMAQSQLAFKRHSSPMGWGMIMRSLFLLSRGYIRESFALLPICDETEQTHSLSVTDTVNSALHKILRGTLLMLLCRFDEARKEFVSIDATQIPAELVFLRREAHLKVALIESLFGDVRAARSALRLSKEVPRTSSWMETQLDATELLAAAASCEREDRSALVRVLCETPLQTFGAIWPFAVLGLQRLADQLDRNLEFRTKLDLLIASAPAHIEGNGYTGSVFQLCRGMIALQQGDIARAREVSSTADHSLLLTEWFNARLDKKSGAAELALRYALSIRPHTRCLRQLEIWRTSLEVSALLALSSPEDAKMILVALLKEMSGLNEEERRVFSPEVHDFALKSNIQWPEWPPLNESSAIAPSIPSLVLSPREREVLAQVALGWSRSEIAQTLFLSENTIKSHLSTLYKKLGVASRAQLIVEARLRSIV